MFDNYRKSEIGATILMWVITIGTGIYILVMYPGMPDKIPIHFGLWGQPDAWGSKNSIFFLFGMQIMLVLVEQWGLHTAVKSTVKSGNPTMINRNCTAITGPIVSGIFVWCVVGTISYGRLGKYFVFAVFGVVVIVIAVALISQNKDRKRIEEFRQSTGVRQKKEAFYRDEKRDDTIEISDLKFQGKVALWMWMLLIFINGIILWSVTGAYGQGKEGVASGLISIIVLLMIDLLMGPMYFRNYILLSEEELLIVVGFIKKRIRYENIELLEETHNPISSLAMSLDRIYIHTSSGDDVLVAVKDKQAFIKEVGRRAGI